MLRQWQQRQQQRHSQQRQPQQRRQQRDRAVRRRSPRPFLPPPQLLMAVQHEVLAGGGSTPQFKSCGRGRGCASSRAVCVAVLCCAVCVLQMVGLACPKDAVGFSVCTPFCRGGSG